MALVRSTASSAVGLEDNVSAGHRSAGGWETSGGTEDDEASQVGTSGGGGAMMGAGGGTGVRAGEAR
ncbi:MAG: hypothetical protein KF716_08980 [Anaerolineae bacterium]|nr:hypothetical protein [Anaerolineae bacterium]